MYWAPWVKLMPLISPIRSWPRRAWVGMPKTVVIAKRPLSPAQGRGDASVALLLDQWAVALVDGAEGLVRRDRGPDLVVVPRILRLRGLLHLDQVRRVDLPTVGSDRALAEQRVVGRRLLHPGDDLGAVVALERL